MITQAGAFDSQILCVTACFAFKKTPGALTALGV